MLRLAHYRVGLLLRLTYRLLRLRACLIFDLLCEGARRKQRVAYLGLLPVERLKLRAQQLIFLPHSLRLLLDVAEQGIDLIRVIIFLLDHVYIDGVEKLFIQSHSSDLPPGYHGSSAECGFPAVRLIITDYPLLINRLNSPDARI